MINTTTASATAQSSTATTAKGSSKISADFETFLKMLTVQMTNQDPLNPVESADYAVQLATFSGVEQQVQTNDLLKALKAGLQSSGLGAMASWIGKEVPATGPVRYDGTPLTIAPNLKGSFDKAVAEVRDVNGTVVDRFEISPQQGQLTWPRSASHGSPPPTGVYEITLATFKDGAPVSQTPAPVFQRITEVRETAKGGALVLQNGTTIAQSDVKSMREGRSP